MAVLAGVGILRRRIPTGEDAVFDLGHGFYVDGWESSGGHPGIAFPRRSCKFVIIFRTPCSCKNSRSFVSNRGLSDPNPGPYRALLWKNGESGPV